MVSRRSDWEKDPASKTLPMSLSSNFPTCNNAYSIRTVVRIKCNKSREIHSTMPGT